LALLLGNLPTDCLQPQDCYQFHSEIDIYLIAIYSMIGAETGTPFYEITRIDARKYKSQNLSTNKCTNKLNWWLDVVPDFTEKGVQTSLLHTQSVTHASPTLNAPYGPIKKK
jgi:hypothetical protein